MELVPGLLRARKRVIGLSIYKGRAAHCSHNSTLNDSFSFSFAANPNHRVVPVCLLHSFVRLLLLWFLFTSLNSIRRTHVASYIVAHIARRSLVSCAIVTLDTRRSAHIAENPDARTHFIVDAIFLLGSIRPFRFCLYLWRACRRLPAIIMNDDDSADHVQHARRRKL